MSNVRKSLVSNCEKKFLLKNLADWTRLDGRIFDEFREVKIDFGKDWGSCYTSLGKTSVLAQVSCEIQQPNSRRPSEGKLFLNIELNPLAAPQFEAGRQTDLSVQLNRLLEKCLKDSKAVDLESLCIKMNEKVWAIRVDINVLNHEGNILDCASIAALAALAHFRRPDVTCDGEDFVIHSVQQRDPLPLVIHHYPVCITYSIFNGGEFIIADPNLLEEDVADACMCIGLNAYKELCGLHLGGKADLPAHVIMSTAGKAAQRAVSIVQQIKDAVEDDSENRLNRQKQGFNVMDLIGEASVQSDISQHIEDKMPKPKKSKKKHKFKKEKRAKDGEMDVEETVASPVAEVKECGEGTAALIPVDNEADKVWTISDSDELDEDEVVVIEVPKPFVDLSIQTDSEEENVLVLNEKSKSKKKKKSKKSKE